MGGGRFAPKNPENPEKEEREPAKGDETSPKEEDAPPVSLAALSDEEIARKPDVTLADLHLLNDNRRAAKILSRMYVNRDEKGVTRFANLLRAEGIDTLTGVLDILSGFGTNLPRLLCYSNDPDAEDWPIFKHEPGDIALLMGEMEKATDGFSVTVAPLVLADVQLMGIRAMSELESVVTGPSAPQTIDYISRSKWGREMLEDDILREPPTIRQEERLTPSSEQREAAEQWVADAGRAVLRDNGKPDDDNSVAAAMRSAGDKVIADIRRYPVKVRADVYSALSVLTNGRWKTQFETGTSNGTYEPTARAMAEERGLGIPRGIREHRRPVYGYVDVAGVESDVSQYGGIEFVLKDAAKDRTSITIGDSLAGFQDGTLVGRYLTEDRGTFGFVGEYSRDLALLAAGKEHRYADWYSTGNWFRPGVPYVEAQIYEGLSVNDIDRVVIHVREVANEETDDPKPVVKRLTALLRKRGIAYEVDKGE